MKEDSDDCKATPVTDLRLPDQNGGVGKQFPSESHIQSLIDQRMGKPSSGTSNKDTGFSRAVPGKDRG